MKKGVLSVSLTLAATAALLTLSSYLAVTCLIDNITVFAALTVVFPILCVAIASFFLGYQIQWNWKKGLCLALALTLISFGTGALVMRFAGDSLQQINTESGTVQSDDDALMQEIYDELDRQAYEYMVEQGIISEGDEIYAGDPAINGAPAEEGSGSGDVTDSEMVRSEMYVGIQKSDPTTELLGSIVDFVLAFVFGLLGYKVKNAGKTSAN